MAQFSVNAQRFDPYKNFKFRVKWDGRYVAGVSKVGALKRTTEVVKHREGGDPSSSRKSPGRTEYEAITLERGVTHDTEFEKWANKVWNFGVRSGRGGLAQGLPQGHHHRDLQRSRPAGHRLQGLSLLGLGVSGASRSRRQRQRRRDSDDQARERRLGARLRGARAGRTDLHRAAVAVFGSSPRRHAREGPIAFTVLAMRTPTAAELLTVWERGLAQPPARRGLLLLTAADPETPPEMLARLTIGARDARLLALREWLFGSTVNCVTKCPGCGDRVEFTFTIADVCSPAGASGTTLEAEVAVDDYAVRFRLPNSNDLLAIDGCGDVGTARRRLVSGCLLHVRRQSNDIAEQELPRAVVDAIGARMAEADPQADVTLRVTCPACANQWQAAFDIVSHLWTEISAWAARVLREVHALASAYGWSEAESLRLSPTRRQLYLNLIGA